MTKLKSNISKASKTIEKGMDDVLNKIDGLDDPTYVPHRFTDYTSADDDAARAEDQMEADLLQALEASLYDQGPMPDQERQIIEQLRKEEIKNLKKKRTLQESDLNKGDDAGNGLYEDIIFINGKKKGNAAGAGNHAKLFQPQVHYETSENKQAAVEAL
jgi:hypothetical protein